MANDTKTDPPATDPPETGNEPPEADDTGKADEDKFWERFRSEVDKVIDEKLQKVFPVKPATQRTGRKTLPDYIADLVFPAK